MSSQVTTGPHSNSSLLALRDVLRMYDAIVSLLRTCLVLDTPSRNAILTNQAALKAVSSLMLVQCEGMKITVMAVLFISETAGTV